MPTNKLTRAALARLPAPDPSGRPTLHFDTELHGFAVLCSGRSATRSYVVQKKLADRRTRRVTVGQVGVFDPADPGEDLKLARAAAAKLLLQFQEGKDPKAERRKLARRSMTLAEALEDYLAGRKNLAASTAKLYRGLVARHLRPWLDLDLREITGDMVERRHREIAAEIATRFRRGRSATFRNKPGEGSANVALKVFAAIWEWRAARDPDLPPTNPTRRLKRGWFEEKRRRRFLDAEKLPTFWAAVQGMTNRDGRDLLTLMLFTGMRRMEACGLRWSEVDLADRVIRLPPERMKAGEPFDLPMSRPVADLLVARRAVGKRGDHVFPGSGRDGHLADIGHLFDWIDRRTGVRITAHDLRRTYLTVAESTDISPIALKALVAHSLGSDVTSGYIQITRERLRDAAELVATEIERRCGVEPAEGVRRLR